MKPTILIALVVLLAGWDLVSFEVKLDKYEVALLDKQPVISWQARVETDLKHYEIARKRPFDVDFTVVATVVPSGPNFVYTYRDDQIYKYAGENIIYELFAVPTAGEAIGFGPLNISYEPTAVRRTWGSIKAMFQ